MSAQLTSSVLLILMAVAVATTAEAAKKIHYVHWNKASPRFHRNNNDHIIDVKEYDQVNLICPVTKPGSGFEPESHVIYSVSKEEYESCRITNPKPRIVAICNKPHRRMYFTITFRSFTPIPGALEFRPGHDYYFISTSSGSDLHRRVGGGCSTHNMRMIFKVHPAFNHGEMSNDINTIPDYKTSSVFPKYSNIIPRVPQVDSSRLDTESNNSNNNNVVYYYHPRDVIALEKALTQDQDSEDRDLLTNEIFENSPLPFTSSSSSLSWSLSTLLPLLLLLRIIGVGL